MNIFVSGHVHYACVGALHGQGPGSQKTTSDPLYLQLQMVVQRGCLDLNLGPLKEQGALLVTALSVCPASILKFEGLFL